MFQKFIALLISILSLIFYAVFILFLLLLLEKYNFTVYTFTFRFVDGQK